MRRKKRFARGRAVSILVAAGVGYLIGSWNAAAVRRSEASDAPTATETVALRFPQAMSEAPVVQAASFVRQAPSAQAAAYNAELALFEPTPMMPPSAAVPSPAIRPAAQPAPEHTADITPPPVEPPLSARAPISPKSRAPIMASRTRAAAPHVATNRSGYMFDDAELASIKRRLQLTPDQERMWPAVAAALRNIGIERDREARRSGTPAIDPDSAEVADLKSAAIPLLMSFSDEQKDEVRTLAHGMGLDQLASEF